MPRGSLHYNIIIDKCNGSLVSCSCMSEGSLVSIMALPLSWCMKVPLLLRSSTGVIDVQDTVDITDT